MKRLCNCYCKSKAVHSIGFVQCTNEDCRISKPLNDPDGTKWNDIMAPFQSIEHPTPDFKQIRLSVLMCANGDWSCFSHSKHDPSEPDTIMAEMVSDTAYASGFVYHCVIANLPIPKTHETTGVLEPNQPVIHKTKPRNQPD